LNLLSLRLSFPKYSHSILIFDLKGQTAVKRRSNGGQNRRWDTLVQRGSQWFKKVYAHFLPSFFPVIPWDNRPDKDKISPLFNFGKKEIGA